MPAITVRDITVLPRVVADANLRPRRVKSITTAPQGHEGEGFPVRRAFAGVDLADLDPFIHLDQMGEVEYAPGEPKGTPWPEREPSNPLPLTRYNPQGNDSQSVSP